MNPTSTSPASPAFDRRWWARQAAALALLLVAVGLLLYFFQQFPIEGTTLAMDWKGLWAGLHADPPLFGNQTGLRIAPWDVVLLKPLGWLPFRASWGMLTLLTLGVLIASIPTAQGQKRLWLGGLLLATSYPALRNIADGNFELLVIAGLLLTVQGYKNQTPWVLALGLLLATAKGQETWVLALVLGVYVLRTWPLRRLAALFGLLALVTLPTLWGMGQDWIAGAISILERGTLVDSSLSATLTRLGLAGWLVTAVWVIVAALAVLFAWRSGSTFSRQKAAALVAVSLLLAPYAAANSYLTVLSLGIIPLVMVGNPLAIALMVLVDLPYLASRDLIYYGSATYWTALLLLSWAVLAAYLWRAGEKFAGPPVTILDSPRG